MNPQLTSIKQSGIKRVKVLGPGEGNYCCAACSLLVDQEFSVENAPKLPPSDCKCEGGSKIMYIAIQEKSHNANSTQAEKTTADKIQDAGDKMQQVGCALTLFVTIPILILFLFLFIF